MRGDRMYQRTNNYPRRFGGHCDSAMYTSRRGSPLHLRRRRCRRPSYLVGLLLFAFVIQPAMAQEMSPKPTKQIFKNSLFAPPGESQTPTTSAPTTSPTIPTSQTATAR